MSSPSTPRISGNSLHYSPARLKPPYAMRQVSFQAACIAASMEQRSRCTLNGAVPKTTKRCAIIRRRCHICSRRWQSQSSIPECMKLSRPTPDLQQSPNPFDPVSMSAVERPRTPQAHRAAGGSAARVDTVIVPLSNNRARMMSCSTCVRRAPWTKRSCERNSTPG